MASAYPTRVPCSNAAKTRNPLKFAGVPQTPELISAVSGPNVTILGGHVEEVLLFNIFLIVDTCLNCEDIAHKAVQWCAASRVEHISDLHPKFALRPHHVRKYGRHAICDG